MPATIKSSPPAPEIERPMPRAPRSASKVRRIQLQNRRRQWLEQHPEYLDSREHEFADPVLYDKLIRQYQSAAERESEGKSLGYARVLESDIVRSEAKLAELSNDLSASRLSASATSETGHFLSLWALDQRRDETPTTKEEARELWCDFLRDRFIGGDDADFDYATVDGNDELDVQARRDEEEAWFDDDEPSFADSEGEWPEEEQNESRDDRVRRRAMRGETGVQDF